MFLDTFIYSRGRMYVGTLEGKCRHRQPKGRLYGSVLQLSRASSNVVTFSEDEDTPPDIGIYTFSLESYISVLM